MAEQDGRRFREAWIAGVRKHFPGEPKAGYVAPREDTPEWEREAAATTFALVREHIAASSGETARRDDPMRRWKLSPMDLESITRWEDYSRAKDEMLVHTDIPEARWRVVESEDKRRARINMMAHLLSTVPYRDVQPPVLKLPPRPPSRGYVRIPRNMQDYVPDHAAELLAKHS